MNYKVSDCMIIYSSLYIVSNNGRFNVIPARPQKTSLSMYFHAYNALHHLFVKFKICVSTFMTSLHIRGT